ncbi:unnamed protein product, partial [Rotaria sp. Silwood1]
VVVDNDARCFLSISPATEKADSEAANVDGAQLYRDILVDVDIYKLNSCFKVNGFAFCFCFGAVSASADDERHSIRNPLIVDNFDGLDELIDEDDDDADCDCTCSDEMVVIDFFELEISFV